MRVFFWQVLQQFRNRSAIKGMQTEQDPTGRSNKYNYESNNHVDSPRFSLRWEVESSCSTTCSSMSMASCPAALHVDDSRKVNWITTDSDCEHLSVNMLGLVLPFLFVNLLIVEYCFSFAVVVLELWRWRNRAGSCLGRILMNCLE